MANISPFRAALPDLSDIISFDEFFASVKRKFPLYLSDGIYEQITNESFFVYRIKRSHRSHTGIIACADVLDYIHGKIKVHENTLAAKEDKMMRLFNERNALIKPLLLTYPNALAIDAYINRLTISMQPSFVIPFLDEEHVFWQIDDKKQIETLKELFKEHVPETYICDGHHRAKTSEKLYNIQKENNPNHTGNEPYNYVLAAYFSASEIEVHNYNRLLVSTKNLTPDAFLDKLKEIYHVYGSPKSVNPTTEHQLGLFLDKQWYRLTLKDEYMPPPETTPPNEHLDVYILNKLVFGEILNIYDVRTEVDVRYMEGPKGTFSLERKVRESKAVAAFSLYPVALERLMEISDVSGTMPPKSTWIEPRMRNGFIVQLYTDL